tara:strand:- start:397 stop:1194 length:798 start_codon:yes stop_codon:yes gene_type:complete
MRYKNFIITGAASGLGESLARKLLADGKNVIGIDKDKIKINTDNLSGNLKTIIFDLKDYEKIDQLLNEVEIQNIDCLINCAGYETAGFVDDLPLEEITRNFNVNTMAPIALTKFLLPIFKKNKACIINVISAMATIGVPGRLAYCMSKSALQMFSNVTRAEFKYFGINVITIYPEVMETPFWNSVAYFGRIQAAKMNDPRKRKDPNDVADEVIKTIKKDKSFLWRLSMTNLFVIFYGIFTTIADKIVDVICNIKDSNIIPKNKKN